MFSEAADKLDLPFFSNHLRFGWSSIANSSQETLWRERERIKGFCARAYAQSCTCSTLHIGLPPHLII